MFARPHDRASGFTIVELVAVIAIIAIIAAYAAPLFVGSAPLAQRGYADELANTLRLARGVAVATNCDVQFSINAGTYQVMQRAATASGTSCLNTGAFITHVRRADGNNVSGYPPAGVSVPGIVSFIFSQDGGSIVGGVAPPAIAVGAFTVTVSNAGWVQVQ